MTEANVDMANDLEEINISNVDSFYQKRKTLDVVTEYLDQFKGTVVDIGCGRMAYKKVITAGKNVERYIGVDIENPQYQLDVKPDIYWDGVHLPLPGQFADVVLMTDVIEHLPQPINVLKDIYRIMKKDGFLFATLPFLWPLHDVPNDEFRYTPFSLERLLKSAYFDKINIYPLGGWNASLATMLGLWLKRGPGNDELKNELSKTFIELYKILIQNDVPDYKFSESQMYTGFLIVASK